MVLVLRFRLRRYFPRVSPHEVCNCGDVPRDLFSPKHVFGCGVVFVSELPMERHRLALAVGPFVRLALLLPRDRRQWDGNPRLRRRLGLRRDAVDESVPHGPRRRRLSSRRRRTRRVGPQRRR